MRYRDFGARTPHQLLIFESDLMQIPCVFAGPNIGDFTLYFVSFPETALKLAQNGRKSGFV